MKKILAIVLVILFVNAGAHPWKPDYYVIVDTDCGFDDFRALNLLLASSSIRVLGITVSDGVADARTGYFKVKSLLENYNHQGVLVGVNSNLNKTGVYKDHTQYNWGPFVDTTQNIASFEEVISQIREFSNESIVFINLGSLNTLNSYLDKHPDFSKRILISTFGRRPELENSFNFRLDKESYHAFQKKNIPFIEIYSSDKVGSYQDKLITSLSNVKNKYAESYLHSIVTPQSPYCKIIYDELVALYLNDSLLFSNLKEQAIEVNEKLYKERKDSVLCKILDGTTVNKNQSFSYFPVEEKFYMSDIEPRIDQTIQKFGIDEWKACAITNELHQHVGIYSLIGAKMGVRAREYFGAGVDEMKVETFVGNTPPLSCMNDGLQVSTGATIGHGLITVLDIEEKAPKARFRYLGQTIEVSLKQAYIDKIRQEIKSYVLIYGTRSNIYWDLVRQAALNYWFNWDRNEIFEIEKIVTE